MLILKEKIVLGLTLISGIVDALAYLTLGHVFVANMTGNLVLLFIALARGHGRAAIRSTAALLGFILGAGLGSMLIKESKRGLPLGWLLGSESVLLSGFTIFLIRLGTRGHWPILLIIVAAVAMGVQSAMARYLNVAGTTTTVITSTLTQILSDVVVSLRNTGAASEHAANRQALLRLAVFLIYGLGALISGLLRQCARLAAMLAAVLALFLWWRTRLQPDPR
jgi:uncharacterized membrane protein YoaK (UPF0700 family)